MKQYLKKNKSELATFLRFPWLYLNPSFSQEGEDILLKKIFKYRKKGFFVDVGAHHPYRYSNTYALYQLGWSGINIDATPDSMTAFQKARPRDTNLELVISDATRTTQYYIFEDSALNTLDPAASQRVISSGQSKLSCIIELQATTLKKVLSNYLPQDTLIDFLNIDVEGADLQVLKSNDWKRYLPKVIAIEESSQNSPTHTFLTQKGYRSICRTISTTIFLHQKDSL